MGVSSQSDTILTISKASQTKLFSYLVFIFLALELHSNSETEPKQIVLGTLLLRSVSLCLSFARVPYLFAPVYSRCRNCVDCQLPDCVVCLLEVVCCCSQQMI